METNSLNTAYPLLFPFVVLASFLFVDPVETLCSICQGHTSLFVSDVSKDTGHQSARISGS